MIKLLDISKSVISRYNKDEVYDFAYAWSEEYDPDLKKLLEDDKLYTLKVLGIERGNEKPRKDISKWSDDKQTWFNKMKDLSEELGYAREVKEYKQNPDSFKGHVGDISTVIRISLTR